MCDVYFASCFFWVPKEGASFREESFLFCFLQLVCFESNSTRFIHCLNKLLFNIMASASAVTKTEHVKKEFFFDWQFKLETRTKVSSESFYLPGEGHELSLYANGHCDFLILHKKPFPAGRSFLLQLIGREEKVQTIDLEDDNDTAEWSDESKTCKHRSAFLLWTGEFEVMEFEDLEKDWKLDNGSYQLRLTITEDEFKEASNYRGRFKASYQEAFGADFIIKVKGQEMRVSKAILMSQWAHFRTMLEANLSEKQQGVMNIDDFDYDVINAFVVYLYSEELDLKDVDFSIQLLGAADKYGAIELKDKCETFAINNITKEGAWNILSVAKLYNANQLVLAALKQLVTLDVSEIEKLPNL